MQAPPAVHARQTGGFNQGLGNFSDEHLFERENVDALKHQQEVMEDTKAELPASPEPPKQHAESQVEELKQIGPDLLQQLQDFVNFKKWIGLEDKKLSPEQEAAAKLKHQRWLQLDAEQQQVAIQEKQRRDAQKRQEEEERAQRKQAEEQASQRAFVVPSGKHTGAPNAEQRLQDQRTKQGNAGTSDLG